MVTEGLPKPVLVNIVLSVEHNVVSEGIIVDDLSDTLYLHEILQCFREEV